MSDEKVLVTPNFFDWSGDSRKIVWTHDEKPAPKPGEQDGWTWFSSPQTGRAGVMYVSVPHAGYGEYDDSLAHERANYEFLAENFSDEVVRVGYSTHDGMQIFLRVGSYISEYLHDLILGIRDDRALLDDDSDGIVRREIERECVKDAWILNDFLDDEHHDADEVEAAYWRLRSRNDLDWECETSTSGYIVLADPSIPHGERDARIAQMIHDEVDAAR